MNWWLILVNFYTLFTPHWWLDLGMFLHAYIFSKKSYVWYVWIINLFPQLTNGLRQHVLLIRSLVLNRVHNIIIRSHVFLNHGHFVIIPSLVLVKSKRGNDLVLRGHNLLKQENELAMIYIFLSKSCSGLRIFFLLLFMN